MALGYEGCRGHCKPRRRRWPHGPLFLLASTASMHDMSNIKKQRHVFSFSSCFQQILSLLPRLLSTLCTILKENCILVHASAGLFLLLFSPVHNYNFTFIVNTRRSPEIVKRLCSNFFHKVFMRVPTSQTLLFRRPFWRG